MYHYYHMAKGNIKEYLKNDQVWVKKYLYVIHPILACIWINRELGPIPTKFIELVDALIDDKELKREILDLVQLKKNGEELRYGDRLVHMDKFIEYNMALFDKGFNDYKKSKPDTEILNKIFSCSLIVHAVMKSEEEV